MKPKRAMIHQQETMGTGQGTSPLPTRESDSIDYAPEAEIILHQIEHEARTTASRRGHESIQSDDLFSAFSRVRRATAFSPGEGLGGWIDRFIKRYFATPAFGILGAIASGIALIVMLLSDHSSANEATAPSVVVPAIAFVLFILFTWVAHLVRHGPGRRDVS